MSELLNRLAAHDLVPAFKLSERMQKNADRLILTHRGLTDHLITVPGLPNYLPPMIPNDPDWCLNASKMVRLSFAHLIADIWTQLLVLKRDSKERPLYLFWDHDIPKPTPMTALAWLLMCETWPMPNHRKNGYPIFCPQSFVLPQGTSYGFAGVRPYGYARSNDMNVLHPRSLNGLFVEVLNQDDRKRMSLVAEHHLIHRPPAANATGYGFHTQPAYEREYSLRDPWPRVTSMRADFGYGAHEIQESEEHTEQVKQLRSDVTAFLMQTPGLPTHRDSLHNTIGMHIRFLSESGLRLMRYNKDEQQIPWTPERESIKLEHGSVMPTVPLATPRVWFGFTQTQPVFGEVEQKPAYKLWAESYLQHRPMAIGMLYNTGVNIDSDHELAIVLRGKALARAGRIKTKSAAATTRAAFADAFNNALNQKDK